MNPSPEENLQMLKKAAECYVKAGWWMDACRVWEKMGEYQQAALIYEQEGNWLKAGECYRKIENWKKAAECYQKGEEAEAALECWLKAGEILQVAWIWVDTFQQSHQSQAEIKKILHPTESQKLEIELITARWEASGNKTRESGKRLRELLEVLRKELRPSKRYLYEWGLKIAKEIKRPDLTALIYATAYRAKMPNVCKEWEIWAIETLGDATGIPQEEAEGKLESYEFEVVRVNRKGEIIEREWKQARYFAEELGKGIEIEMVYILGGTFMMGSPKEEKDSYDDEKPQHQVTVEEFYLGKYQVTQAQWKAVVNLPKIERDLKPDPSDFKGENRPVEQVSWEDAVEFCARLSKVTGKEYRLPSEAEWEYACRAGTSTPFHYGETITSELANYYGNTIYAEEPAGEYRRETTPVGSFPPNGFGLYDMHGNVCEWCADLWHSSYEGAPNDGRVWVNENDNDSHSLRGGSWFNNSWYCRSAYRNNYDARYDVNVGFRVCCVVGRT